MVLLRSLPEAQSPLDTQILSFECTSGNGVVKDNIMYGGGIISDKQSEEVVNIVKVMCESSKENN
jgi:hypothetical protein